MSDNLYPNAGDDYNTAYYPAPPAEQTEEIAASQAIKAASYPILPSIGEWFENQINECDNIHNIQVTSITINGIKYSRDISVQAQVLAYQLLKEKLQEKYDEFKDYKHE